VITYLHRQGFNPNAVRPAARAFLETMSYLEEIGVSESHGGGQPPPGNSNPGATPEVVYGGAGVGDLVQWESEGALKLEAPVRVRALQTLDGKEWVFVEGSETGIPMEQVIVEQKGQIPPMKPPPSLPLASQDQPKAGWHEERLIDDSGHEIFIRYEGEPSAERYEFIRDYLDFKLRRLAKGATKT
jgi:hypothetical protein